MRACSRNGSGSASSACHNVAVADGFPTRDSASAAASRTNGSRAVKSPSNVALLWMSPRDATARIAGMTMSGSLLSSAPRSGTSADSSCVCGQRPDGTLFGFERCRAVEDRGKNSRRPRRHVLRERAQLAHAPLAVDHQAAMRAVRASFLSVAISRPHGSSTSDAAS